MARQYLGWVALFTTASAFSVSCGSSDGKAPSTSGGSAGKAAGAAGKPSAGASSGGSAGSGATGGGATGGGAGRASAGSSSGGTAGRGASGSGNGAGRGGSGAGRGGTGGQAGDAPSDGGMGGESACPEGSACGDACRDFCEARNNECPTTPTDCDDSCNTFGTVAAAAGCQAEVDDLNDCFSEPGINVCASDTCQDETDAFTACGLQYCLTHLTDPVCLSLLP